MYKLLWGLLSILAATIASGNTVAQKVMFSGFPGVYGFRTTYSTSYDQGGGSAAFVLKNSYSVAVTYPYGLPPTDPIEYSDEQYRAICDDLDPNGSCHADFTSILSYDNNKSCTVKINLSIEVEPSMIHPGGETKHHHSNSVSGDCKIKGGDGDDLWTVTPK